MISICNRIRCNAQLKIGSDGRYPLHSKTDSSADTKADMPCAGSYQMCYDPKFVTIEICPRCKEDVTVSKSARNIGHHFYENGEECSLSFHNYDNEVGQLGIACKPTKMESGNFPPA